jgi:DnaJ-domain-containing protein 1
MIWGRVIGFIVGARLLGFFGALIGFWLGFMVDHALRTYQSLRRGATHGAGTQQTFHQTIYTVYEDPLAEAYRVLGVSRTATDAEIKQRYRRLMNQHHPDKMLARGLPSSQLPAAQKKTQAIRAAYDQIRAQRELVS